MGCLKGRKIRTVEDGDGMAIMIGKVEEGHEVALSGIGRRGIVVAIHLIDIPWKGGEHENLGTRN